MESYNIYQDQLSVVQIDGQGETGANFFKSYQLIQHISNQNLSITFMREGLRLKADIAIINIAEYPFVIGHLVDILHDEELSYFNALQFEKRKKEYLLAHYAAKIVSSSYLCESDFSQVEIASGYFRQPIVKYKAPDIPEISLSHCADIAVAISCDCGHPIGIDVEKLDPKRTSILKSQLTEKEQSWVSEQDVTDMVLYNQLWTIKESLSKAIKCGLTVPFEVLEIQKQYFHNDFLICEFKNFGQYKCYSWVVNGYALSITVPKKTEISLDIDELKCKLISDSSVTD